MPRRLLLVAILVALMPLVARGQGTDCTVSATGVDFGILGLLEIAAESTGEISVNCTSGVAFTVGLDGGQANAGPSGREMSAATSSLPYGLYKDSARSEVWGAEGDSAGPVSGTGDGSTQVLTVYGRIPSQRAPVPGTYTDTITITVTY